MVELERLVDAYHLTEDETEQMRLILLLAAEVKGGRAALAASDDRSNSGPSKLPRKLASKRVRGVAGSCRRRRLPVPLRPRSRVLSDPMRSWRATGRRR
jgi:hypothetical protein